MRHLVLSVVDTPRPVKPTEPISGEKDDDVAWDKRKMDHAPVKMAYTLENQKWQTTNKKCMAFVKYTIENCRCFDHGICQGWLE
jgi:hypothetical protein